MQKCHSVDIFDDVTTQTYIFLFFYSNKYAHLKNKSIFKNLFE